MQAKASQCRPSKRPGSAGEYKCVAHAVPVLGRRAQLLLLVFVCMKPLTTGTASSEESISGCSTPGSKYALVKWPSRLQSRLDCWLHPEGSQCVRKLSNCRAQAETGSKRAAGRVRCATAPLSSSCTLRSTALILKPERPAACKPLRCFYTAGCLWL